MNPRLENKLESKKQTVHGNKLSLLLHTNKFVGSVLKLNIVLNNIC